MKRSTFQVACLFLAVFFTLAACNTESRQHVESTLSDVESYINEHPDSALVVLQTVDSTALTTRALRARYSLLRTMAQDKCYLDITAPGLLDAAATWYEHHGTADEKMKSLYYQGRIAQDKTDRNSAAVYFARAEEYAESVTDKHALALLYLAEATVYNSIYNTDKEKEFREKALAVLKESQDPMYESALGSLAFVYHKQKNWYAADSLYAKAILLSEKNPHVLPIYLSNYARMKVQQPDMDPEGSIRLLNRKRSISGGLTPMEAGAYAYALALLGRSDASEILQIQLDTLTGRARVDVLPWLMDLAVFHGDYQRAYSYLAEARSEEDETISETLTDSVTQALQDYYEQSTLHEREQRFRQGVWWLAIIIFLLMLTMIQLYIAHKNRVECDRLLSIRRELEQDLRAQETRTETLTDDFSSRLAQLRVQLQQERLGRLRKSGRYSYWMWMEKKGRFSDSEIIKTLRKDIQDVCSLEKDTSALEQRLNTDLDGIVSHLKNDLGFSDRSDESRFLCYWLINLRPDMVAELLGISTNNVYVKAHRLEARIKALNKQEYSSLLEQ